MSEDQPVFNAPEALQKAVDAALTEIKGRSFAERHPELGRKINCPVCALRHYSSKKCVQRFKELYIEEDLDTGEKTTVYAVANQGTAKGVLGAALFAKKRFNPHLNRRKRLFAERVLLLFSLFERDSRLRLTPEERTKTLAMVRKIVGRELREEAKIESNRIRRQQDVSRRINNGLLPPGSR